LIKTFTVFRPNVPTEGQHAHDENQRNAPDQPQFEGVIFSDGNTVIRWLTAKGSTSVFKSFEDMNAIHGHPEYGTYFVWGKE